MHFLYNLIIVVASSLLKIIALFSPKIKLFVSGRKSVFDLLAANLKPNDRTIWVHAASLGEYEQGLPIIEKLKEKYPEHKIIITFFSPSGYEVRKNNTVANITLYLPLDTRANAKKFIKLVNPEMVFFIKYEFWINYLAELKKQQIPTYLISGIFREKQLFFKWYGAFYRKALESFTRFFVQNDTSKQLINQLGFKNVTVSGDTRFDRVASILEKDNNLAFISNFKNNVPTIVIGSSWPKDEELLIKYINNTNQNVKFIIAPHNIKADQIQQLQSNITKKVVRYSEMKDKNLEEYEVFIIDTIGILTKIYSYADIAYVGGGFGNPGVHNILEPATFGVPIVIGSNYSHFAEATSLVGLKGCFSISNQEQLQSILDKLITNIAFRKERGEICSQFISNNKGATNSIMNKL
ncbi:3-deoxy-D-manno-octulosonic acid transferase [Flavobacterium algicola]|uniref:3-deoxy-D-manno-octulosonic acid transferase n=1 Tax=Flavobacterium algicola TaxID=556529 RepID=UPI001EFC9B6B|nr:glycosyltransferase N-terminal domain-containing protein [Flavobacterium algicola]MCG9791443.1 3-deoxy-D-manno-octulosonic acid transferase [Flavobacterium algicola]